MAASLASTEPGYRVLVGPPAGALAQVVWRLHEAQQEARKDPGMLLVVAEHLEAQRSLVADLSSMGLRAEAWRASGIEPYDPVATDHEAVFEQASLRFRLLEGENPDVVVALPDALCERIPPAEELIEACASYEVGQDYGRDAITEHLVLCGYNPAKAVEEVGTFCVRGSLIDIFPPGRRDPIRFDLFGDELEQIIVYDAESGDRKGTLPGFQIHPIRPTVFTPACAERALGALQELAESEELRVPSARIRFFEEGIRARHFFYELEGLWPLFYAQRSSLLEDLAGQIDAVLVASSLNLDEAVESYHAAQVEARNHAEARGELALPMDHFLLDETSYRALLDEMVVWDEQTLALDDAPSARLSIDDWGELQRELGFRRKDPERGELLEPVVESLRNLARKGYQVCVSAHGAHRAKKLQALFRDRRFDLPIYPELWRGDAGAWVCPKALARGFIDRDKKRAVLTEYELFDRPLRRNAAGKRSQRVDLSRLKSLREGDPVIHVEHGIGLYRGLKRLVLDGVDGDFVHIDYSGNDKLYLPVYKIAQIQPYQGGGEPKIDALGGTRWVKAKQKVKDSIQAIAHQLLAVQAQRAARKGFALEAPGEAYRQMVDAFPFTETKDQAKAIVDVEADLRKETPMDRLLCGDVGFGKTEVAMRAAFISVLSGRQVGVLVPTTVLAEQHGRSFRERLEQFGVQVAVVNRFRSKKEVTEITEGLKSGEIDIIIGTHRLLSADVHFKELGLLVIDEEQRFGVRHKERIKALKTQVHVLTMSATPIPRTLNMAVMGLRDLSLILTPPTERMAISTEVLRYDEGVVHRAVSEELQRGGQVFFVHNRVQSIHGVAESLRELVPDARVAVAHGQMTGAQLEKIMTEFVRREFDILVATAIIESGIDIPTVNTMVVDRADTFGLSQLHQLRGRIGRGKRKAYCYLLMPRGEQVTREAAERLAALKRHSDLGAGFHIANRDMDIRGAGDLLGEDQSGSIAAVGFELYGELLREAVEAAKGNEGRALVEPELKLPVRAVIPEDYLPDPLRRVSTYQELADARDDESRDQIVEDMEDGYGPIPPEVSALVELMKVRSGLQRLGATALSAAVREGALKVGVAFHEHAAVDRTALAGLLQRKSDRYKLAPSGRLIIDAEAPREVDGEISDIDFLVSLQKVVDALPVSRAERAEA